MSVELILQLVGLAVVGIGVVWRQSARLGKTDVMVVSLSADVKQLLAFEKKTIERWADHEARIRNVEGRNGRYSAEDA